MLDVTKAPAVVAQPSVQKQDEGGTKDNTLDNLEANILKELGLPEDGASGAPEGTTSEPKGTLAAGEPKVEDKTAEATAKAERLSQDNARIRATLTKLGVDPDSDTAEHIRTGLITFEDIIRAKQPASAAPSSTKSDVAVPIPLDQKLINLRNKRAALKGEVSAEQFFDLFDTQNELIMDLVQANQTINRQQEISANERKVQSMISAAQDVFNKDVLAGVPKEPELQEIAQEMFLGAADIEHVGMQRQYGERANTPEYFRHTATQIAPRFNKFIQAVYKKGAQDAIDTINKGKPSGQKLINPLQPGAGGGSPPPPPPPKGKFGIENLEANVEEFLSNTQLQV